MLGNYFAIQIYLTANCCFVVLGYKTSSLLKSEYHSGRISIKYAIGKIVRQMK